MPSLEATFRHQEILEKLYLDEITVWSWDIAAKALEANIPGFNKLFPNVKVKVLDIGNQATYDRGLAGCAAGGGDLPDVYSVENNEAEVFWARFPNCFTDLNTLQPAASTLRNQFPAFKWTELTVGNKVFAMPWDSGPVVMFYRRDIYSQAGVNSATMFCSCSCSAISLRVSQREG